MTFFDDSVVFSSRTSDVDEDVDVASECLEPSSSSGRGDS